MRHARAYALVGLVTLAAAAVAFAQSTVLPLEEEVPVESAPLEVLSVAEILEGTTWGDPDNGAALASTCAACHGMDGKATVRDIYPSMGGQSERYMAHQLALFKTGERMSPIMQPFAEMLSGQEMRDVGAYYALQESDSGLADDTVVEAGPFEGAKFYEIGEKLFVGGDMDRGIPACMACHGPAGAGNPGPAYPQVAGQPSWYAVQRLQAYRDGSTQPQDPRLFNIMAQIASDLTDEEIQALGSYMEGLHARPDAATRAAMAQVEVPAEAPAPAEPAPDTADGDEAGEGDQPADGDADTDTNVDADADQDQVDAGEESQEPAAQS
ncbi:c-type cytochrome [Luteimonas sp. A478]